MGPSPSKRDDWLDEPICDSHAVQQLFSTSIAEVRRLPGWTWGVQVTGIGDAPPPVWPPELWLFVETAAMRHGLVVFNTAGASDERSGRGGAVGRVWAHVELGRGGAPLPHALGLAQLEHVLLERLDGVR